MLEYYVGKRRVLVVYHAWIKPFICKYVAS